MKRICTILVSLACMVPASAQNVGSLFGALLGMVSEGVSAVASDSEAQVGVPQQALSKWGIAPANYSGITPLGDGRYAVVSDKGSADGFYVWKISQDPATGAISSVENEGFFANKVNATSGRDCEGVAFYPKSGTVFISGETDGRVIEYDMEGQRTGRELQIPEAFGKAVGNQGLEALGFGGKGGKARFWTTTETSLPADGVAAGPKNPGGENLLRLQSFKKNLAPSKQFLYTMDAGRTSDFGSTYVFGVPEVCALPDGRVLVLEREANIPSSYVGADVKCKLYVVKPKGTKPLAKTLVAEWSTSMSLAGLAWANYEGMCLGAKLSDGRQTLILVSDSQGGYSKGPFSLQDFIKVIYL
ncbi:MAG: esterase-like activity of phytase family protein [Bacteroidales bacterium]|nr:esterase-like activity of phytase family protein [Bacteroidales bacterium]